MPRPFFGKAIVEAASEVGRGVLTAPRINGQSPVRPTSFILANALAAQKKQNRPANRDESGERGQTFRVEWKR